MNLFLWIIRYICVISILNCTQFNCEILFYFAVSCLIVSVHILSSAYTLKLQLLIFFHYQLILADFAVNGIHIFILFIRLIPWLSRSLTLFVWKAIATPLILLLYLNLEHLRRADNISADIFIEFSLRSLYKQVHWSLKLVVFKVIIWLFLFIYRFCWGLLNALFL